MKHSFLKIVSILVLLGFFDGQFAWAASEGYYNYSTPYYRYKSSYYPSYYSNTQSHVDRLTNIEMLRTRPKVISSQQYKNTSIQIPASVFDIPQIHLEHKGWMDEIFSERLLFGDVSGNGSISSYDATLILRHVVGIDRLTGEALAKADVSGNGSVTSYDASLILRYNVGRIANFPVEARPPKSLKITKTDGTELIYEYGVLSSIKKGDIYLAEVGLDGDGKIDSCTETLSDGTIYRYEGGEYVWVKTTDGTEVELVGGKVRSVSKVDGTKALYGDDGKLESLEFPDGSLYAFENGTLFQIKDREGNLTDLNEIANQMSQDELEAEEERLKGIVNSNTYLSSGDRDTLTTQLEDIFNFIKTTSDFEVLVASTSQGLFRINWQAIEGATSYTLELSENKDFSDAIAYSNIETTSYGLDNLESGKLYYFRVRSYKERLAGLWSESLWFVYFTELDGSVRYKIVTTKGETRRYNPIDELISYTDSSGVHHKNDSIYSPLQDVDIILRLMNPVTGLVLSYDDLSNFAYTYDQALAVIVLVSSGHYSEAKKILQIMQSLQADKMWCEAYDVNTARIVRGNRHTGFNSFMIMAINWYTSVTGDTSFLTLARNTAIRLLLLQNMDEGDSRYGSLKGGYEIAPVEWISTEHNIDAYVAIRDLGAIISDTNFLTRSLLMKEYLDEVAWDDIGGRFYTGYNDVTEYLDPQTFGVLGLGSDYTSAMNWADEEFRRRVNYNNLVIDGYDIDGEPTWFPNPEDCIWIEGTGQASLAWYELGDVNSWNYFLDQIYTTRFLNAGYPYSIQEVRYPYNYPFTSVASISWHYFAATRINPFDLQPVSID